MRDSSRHDTAEVECNTWGGHLKHNTAHRYTGKRYLRIGGGTAVGTFLYVKELKIWPWFGMVWTEKVKRIVVGLIVTGNDQLPSLFEYAATECLLSISHRWITIVYCIALRFCIQPGSESNRPLSFSILHYVCAADSFIDVVLDSIRTNWREGPKRASHEFTWTLKPKYEGNAVMSMNGNLFWLFCGQDSSWTGNVSSSEAGPVISTWK